MTGVANVPDFRLSVGALDLRNEAAAALGELLDITETVRPRLISLSLTEKRGGEADELDITLDDTDGLLELPRKGQSITLQLGWAQGAGVKAGLVDKGSFTVDEVEWSDAPAQVRLTARSADLTAGFRVRRERAHTDTTLGEIARKIAAAHGWRARVAPELAAIAVPALAQAGQSDMALLRRLGRDHDAVASVKNRTLILSPIGKGATASGKPLAGITIRRTDGAGARYREVERTADAGVEARWHDSASATRKTVKVGGGEGRPHRLKRVYHDEAEARAAATAANRRAQRAAAEFEMTLALGRPELGPETPITLAGFKAPIDARRWTIAELTHTLDGSGGLVTMLKLETK